MNWSESERLKYETVWKDPTYRIASRSERRVNALEYHFRTFGAKKIIDLGIGTGRCAMLLKQRGFEVTGVDIAANCLDQGVDIPVTVAPLWEFKTDSKYDALMCIDVLEHIPEEHLPEVIELIGSLAPHGYLVIGLRPERLRPYPEPLHLTLKPWQWWKEKIPFAGIDIDLRGVSAVARY